MEDFFYSDKTMAVDSKKRAKQIQICRILTDRLLKDEYADYAQEQIDKKWGKAQFLTKPFSKNLVELDIVREKVKTEKDKEKVNKEVLSIGKLEQKMIDQDIRLLFNIMRKNIRDWWD